MRSRVASVILGGALALATPVAGQELHQEWAALRYEAALLEGGADPWHQASAELGWRRTRLTPIARVNWASRFDADGYQIEGDLYPAWPGLGYAYVSAAWSEGSPFPELRGAAEVFAALPQALEASLGLVYMDFETDNVTIMVGSLSKYAGNYWLAARPSWAIDNDDVALTLLARRYLRTPGEFVTLRIAGGTTAEEVALTRSRFETLGVQLDGQIEVARRWLVLPLVGVMIAEEADAGPQSGSTHLRVSLGLGAMYRF